MGRPEAYRSHTGTGAATRAYRFSQSPQNDCAEVPTSVTIEHGPIAPGEKVIIESENSCWSYVMGFKATHFIYSGSKDLWLLHYGSDNDCRYLFPTDIHLDSFRPGAPCEVDWGVIHANKIRFCVENRATSKNAQPARFTARIVGLPIS